MRTRRTPPNPGFGPAVELRGGQCRCCLDLCVIGKALARKGIPPEQPPPPFDEIEPAGARRNGLLMEAGMLAQPLPDRATGVAGQVVVDQIELPLRVRSIDGVKELEEACGITGWCREGECLAI